MKLTERLNFAIPLYRDSEDKAPYAWVYAAPFGRAVFEANYMLLAKTWAAIHAEGLGNLAAPRVAALLLKDLARTMAPDGTDAEPLIRGVLNEIRRLSSVLVAGANGWETVPLQEALDKKTIDADDAAEVENALVFFTVVSAIAPRKVLGGYLSGAARLWGAQTSSLTSTAFVASLQTSTTDVSSGVQALPTQTLPPAATVSTIPI